jgi:hypothetical protein
VVVLYVARFQSGHDDAVYVGRNRRGGTWYVELELELI